MYERTIIYNYTEPFTLVEKNDKLYGRGSTDDKGPVLCWIHALQAYKAIGTDIHESSIRHFPYPFIIKGSVEIFNL